MNIMWILSRGTGTGARKSRYDASIPMCLNTEAMVLSQVCDAFRFPYKNCVSVLLVCNKQRREERIETMKLDQLHHRR
jgi:L-2-hydroxyglutarate oxidase LhgO